MSSNVIFTSCAAGLRDSINRTIANMPENLKSAMQKYYASKRRAHEELLGFVRILPSILRDKQMPSLADELQTKVLRIDELDENFHQTISEDPSGAVEFLLRQLPKGE
jgi:hypothetical protein